jgi:hypothetical protein
VAAGPGMSGQGGGGFEGVGRADTFRSLLTMEERRDVDKVEACLERRGGGL